MLEPDSYFILLTNHITSRLCCQIAVGLVLPISPHPAIQGEGAAPREPVRRDGLLQNDNGPSHPLATRPSVRDAVVGIHTRLGEGEAEFFALGQEAAIPNVSV